MKTFRKRLLSLAVLSAMCLLIFSGCGNTEDGKVTDNRTTTDRGSVGSDVHEGMSDMGSDIGDMVTDAGDAIRDGVTAAADAGRDAMTDISKAASDAAQDVRDAVR